MTIQNIEDVMERIMSLNRNLTEESLRTLLSASGWDREDIAEGIRIFRATNKNTVVVDPAPASRFFDPVLEKKEEKIEEEKPEEETYSFNLKKKEEENSAPSLIDDGPLDSSGAKDLNEDSFIGGASDISVATNRETKENKEKVEQNISVKEEIREKEIKTKKENNKKGRAGRIVFLLILLILLGLVAAYLSVPGFTKWVDVNILKQTQTIKEEGLEVGNQDQDLVVDNQDYNYEANSEDQNYIPENFSENEIESLDPMTDNQSTHYNPEVNLPPIEPTIPPSYTINTEEINRLREELDQLRRDLAAYKNTPTGTSNTIVKYVSQPGPAGREGRGIVSVAATSSGFIIDFTDNTKEFIPYSTSTMMEILNTEQVCFRDLDTNVASSSDICIDKEEVLKLLNK